MAHYFTTLALVINKRTSKESDIIITLLTPDRGKIVCFAKGAKSIKSRRLGSLELGNTTKAHLYSKNNYLWLSEIETSNSFLQSEKKLAQINLLFYLLEILNRLIAENQQIDGIFPIAQNIIQAINTNQVSIYIQNEINLIKILGFGLPEEIQKAFNLKNYKLTQKLIKAFFESILESPFESNKLFK